MNMKTKKYITLQTVKINLHCNKRVHWHFHVSLFQNGRNKQNKHYEIKFKWRHVKYAKKGNYQILTNFWYFMVEIIFGF